MNGSPANISHNTRESSIINTLRGKPRMGIVQNYDNPEYLDAFFSLSRVTWGKTFDYAAKNPIEGSHDTNYGTDRNNYRFVDRIEGSLHSGILSHMNGEDSNTIARGFLIDGFNDIRLNEHDYFGSGLNINFMMYEGKLAIRFIKMMGLGSRDAKIIDEVQFDKKVVDNNDEFIKVLRTMSIEPFVDFQYKNPGNQDPRYYLGHFINTGSRWKFVSFETKFGLNDPINDVPQFNQPTAADENPTVTVADLKWDIENITYARNKDDDRIEAAYIYVKNGDLPNGRKGPCIYKYDMTEPQSTSRPFGTQESFNPNGRAGSRMELFKDLSGIVKGSNPDLTMVGFHDGNIGVVQNSTGDYHVIGNNMPKPPQVDHVNPNPNPETNQGIII